MDAERKKLVKGSLAICLAAILWGIDGIVLTPNLYNLRVDYVVFVLHLIPFLIMNLFLYREYNHLRYLTSRDYLFVFLVSLFGGVTGTLSIVKALFLVEFKKLTIVVLLQKLQPVFAIILAMIILNERPRKGFLIWAFSAIVAGYFLTFGLRLPDMDTGTNTVYAALFALLAAFSFGSATVLGKKVLDKLAFQTATFYRYGFTTLIMLFLVIFNGSLIQFHETTTRNWVIFFVIAVTTGSGAIFLYYYGLRRVRAFIATICELCFPLSAILLDYLINNVQLSFIQWISSAWLIFAIVMLNLRYSIKAQE